MAAPVPTARQDPDGFQLRNGHPTLFTMSSAPDLEIWEAEVQPPGEDVGEPIDFSSHHNVGYRTLAAPSLVSGTPHVVTGGYDPAFRVVVAALMGIDQTFTVTFPSGQTLAYFGYIQSYEFSPLVVGEMPTVSLTIISTNFDPVNCVEAPPATGGSGTC